MSFDQLFPTAPRDFDAGNGRLVPFGTFRGPVENTSTTVWDGNGGLLSKRRTQRKAWLYLGAFTESHMVGFAMVDAGLIANGFCYVYDRERDVLVEEAVTVPLGFDRKFAPQVEGAWHLASGRREWTTEFADNAWNATFRGKRLDVSLRLQGPGHGLTAIASSIGRPFAHTYKVCDLPTTIDVSVDGVKGRASGGGSVDFTLGYPPRHTLWNWASMYGHTDDGQTVAVNLVGQFMNGQENGLWIGGKLSPLPQATFEYDPVNPLAPWRIRTLDGTVDLTFEAEGQRRQNLNVGAMASVFSQPFGRFTGMIRHGGQELEVTGLGVVEEHTAVW